jgi:MYXO-CTERM domain-containing protein
MTTKQVGNLMVEMGAWRALNLDGGGSTAMYVEAEDGIVNVPSGPPTQGVERVVANHLGIEIVPPFGRLVGVVADKDEKPLAGAQVALSSGEIAETDAEGAFVLEEAAAGDATLSAMLDGYVEASIDLWVAADETTTASLTLDVAPPPSESDPIEETPPAVAAPTDSASGGCGMSSAENPHGGFAWLVLALFASWRFGTALLRWRDVSRRRWDRLDRQHHR